MTEVSAEAIHASENCNNHNTPTSNTDNSTACSANCSVFHSFFLQAAQSQVLLDTSLVVNIPGYSFYYDQPVIGFEPFPPIQA